VKTHRATLTPQLLDYDALGDRAEVAYQPYLMYFHRAGFRSDAVNTDRLGFRVSHGAQATASLGGPLPEEPVRILSGTSTAFGLGSTSDATTMSSRLWTTYAPSTPWLNMGACYYSSAQELLLYTMHRHLLPPVEEIVIFSGFNNLQQARLPEWQRGEHGAFFFCGEYFEQMDELRAKNRKQGLGFGRKAERRPTEETRELPAIIADAVELTARHLQTLRVLTEAGGTRITFVLQPLATWLRDTPAPQERLLFDELDATSKLGTWDGLYGQISSPETHLAYSAALRVALEKTGVNFVDITPALRETVSGEDWLYVDRAHFTDHGCDVAARLIAETLNLR
jgi:hypothetical protein